MGSNLISFEDLFNFSDDQDIKSAIQLVKELRLNYNDFKKDVIGSTITSFESQMAGIADQVKGVADATKQLNATNEKSQQALVAQIALMEKLRAENEALKASKAGARTTEKALEDSVNGLTQKLKEQVTAFNAMSRSADPEAIRKLGAEIQVTRFEIQELNNTTKGTTSIFNAAKGSYAALDAETKMLVKDLQMMDNGMDKTNMAAQAMVKQIAENTARLKAFDAQIGQNFRSVGNYKTAFDGLGMSVQQILRETPALAISMNTFFLAISNNLPIFFDEFQKVTKEIKAVKAATEASALAAKEAAIIQATANGATQAAAAAQGELAAATIRANAAQAASPGIWSRLASSLFSVNTLLTLVVLGLTLFGGKIVDFFTNMFTAAKAIDFAKENLKEYNKTVIEGNEHAQKQVTQLKVLEKVATDVNTPFKLRLEASKDMIELYPKLLEGYDAESIAAGKAAGAIKKITEALYERAFAEAASERAAKKASESFDLRLRKNFLENEKLKSQNKLNSITGDGQIDAFGSGGSGYTQRAVERQKEEDHLKQLNKLLEENAAKQKNATDQIRFYTNEAAKGYEATNALDTAGYNKGKKKAETDRKKELRDAKKDQRDLEEAIRKQDELIQASAKYQIAQAELRFAKSAQTEQLEVALENEKLKILEKSYQQRLSLYSKDSKQYLTILTQKADAEKENEEKILKIRERGIEERTKVKLQEEQVKFNTTDKGWTDELEFEEKRIAIVSAGFEERLKLYKKDSDDYRNILQAKLDAEEASEAKRKSIRERQGKLNDEINTLSDDVGNIIESGNIRKAQASRKISKTEGESELHKSKVDAINDEIRINQLKLDQLHEGDENYLNKEKEIYKLRKDLAKENADYEVKVAEEAAAKEQALRQALFDFVKTTSQSVFQIGRDLNQASIDDLTNQKNKELDIAGNNSIAKAQIEENYQRKILALKRKQAIFDKLQSLFDIGLNTAVGITAAWKSPATAPFMIPIIIGTGVAQAAAVIAKPLPKYYKGRNKGKREWAEVNDQGFELIERDGHFRVEGKGKNTVTFLEAEDKVHTNTQSKKIISELIQRREQEDYIHSLGAGTKEVNRYQTMKEERLIAAIVNSRISEGVLGAVFEKAIGKIEIGTIEVNERGAERYQKTLSGRRLNLNSRNSMFGNG